jgi:hypothetical protein
MPAGSAGHGAFRASQADREKAIEVLKTAFVQDRLTKDELDLRVGEALASRTYAELAAVTADIPAWLVEDRLPREPARAQDRPPMGNAAKAGICLAIAIAVPAVLTFATGLPLFKMFIPFYFMALLAAGIQMLTSRYDERSRRQLPPRPGQGGQAPEGQRPGRVGHDPDLPGIRSDQTRTDLRTHRSTPGRPRSSRPGAREPRGIWPIPDAV